MAPSPQAGPTDPQIAHIVVTANAVDIDAGKLAETKGTNKDVKAFGKQMVTDHTGVNQQAVALVTKLKVTPEDNPTSQSLKAGGADNLKNLQGLSGAAFDKAYIDHEVAYHIAVLDAIDKTLVPNAKNEELKALIVKVRPAFVAPSGSREDDPVDAQVMARRFAWVLVLACRRGLRRRRAGHAHGGHRRRQIRSRGRSPSTVAIRWCGPTRIRSRIPSRRPGNFDSKSIAAGASWRFKASKPGVYDYICTLHPNMKGTLKVE